MSRPTGLLTLNSAYEAGVEAFVRDLHNAEPLSRRSRQAYAADLRQLCRFLHTRIAGPSIGVVDGATLAEFLQHLVDEGFRPRTVARKLTSIRALYSFLHRVGLVDGSQIRGLHSPPSASSDSGLNPTQIKALLRMPSRTSFTGIRDLALMEMLYGCGLRLEEVLALRVSHIDSSQAHLHIEGSRRRSIPLGPQSVSVLSKYLTARADTLSQQDIQRIDAGHLFVTARGRRLRTRSAQLVFEAYLRRLEGTRGLTSGIDRPRRGATALRKAFAEHSLSTGTDAAAVGKLMGRSKAPTPSTVDMEAVQRRYDQAHPRAGENSES